MVTPSLVTKIKKSVPFCTVSCSWTSSAHPVQSCPAEEFCSHVLSPLQWEYATNMSTGSLSDVDDELLDGILKFGSSGKDSNESTEESSNCEGSCANEERRETPGKKRKTTSRKTAPKGVAQQEGKQVQRNAANARERARMRVLSKAFSRLKTSLPWVPPDTKLSKLDTLRLASSYIAHLRQILANDKYENGYIHPVNLVRMGLRGLYLFAPQISTLPIWSFIIIMKWNTWITFNQNPMLFRYFNVACKGQIIGLNYSVKWQRRAIAQLGRCTREVKNKQANSQPRASVINTRQFTITVGCRPRSAIGNNFIVRPSVPAVIRWANWEKKRIAIQNYLSNARTELN